jgi:nucleoside-diphosphate-sugar epimerase
MEMRIFLTGATGFIGSAIVQELIRSGHQVLGLARSDAGAQSLVAAGAELHRGDLEDLDSLRAGAANADAVIHTGFNHDFSKYLANCESDRRVIEALGDALADTGRVLIVTSGTGVLNSAPGHPCTEDDPPPRSKVVPRAASEEAAASVADRGVRVAIMRLPQIHDTVKQGLVSYAIRVAREKGASAYIGNGTNRWPAAHRLDTAHLYRLALDKGDGGVRYHAVAEEGVHFRDIAESIGRGLGVPIISIAAEEAAGHFGWLAEFVGRDIPASSAQTRKTLGWSPTGPGLIADLDEVRWFETNTDVTSAASVNRKKSAKS